MAKSTAAPRPSRRPRAPRTRNDNAAVRALDTIGEALDAEGKGLARDEVTRAVAERKAVTAYLRGLERAGATISRLPAGGGVVSGQTRRSRARRAVPPPSAQGSPLTAMPGLSDLSLPVQLPFATLTPPYDWQWTWRTWINYAPGTLEAYAHRSNATLGIDIASSHDSNQVNRSRARAAIGVRFQPTETGFLGVRPAVHVDDAWSLKWNHGKAHAFGWTGILVQTFDPAGNLLDTPIDKKRREFDESGGGSIIPPVEIDVALPDGPNFWGTSLFIVKELWYAIWIWCGGGIRAAGWQTVLGMNVGSDASAALDVRVPSIALYFTPLAQLQSHR